MSLTWKDAVTTFLAASVVGVYYAMSKGITLPLITGYRGAILLLAVLGIGMCAFSGGTIAPTGTYKIVASLLGIAALGLTVYGLIVGTKAAFVMLAVTMLVLWVIATVRHLLT